MIFGQKFGDGFAPLDDDDIFGTREIFAEVVGHEAGVGETIKIVVDEIAAGGQGVGFGNGETGAGDRLLDTKTFGETAGESGFAGANIADKFDNGRKFEGFGEIFAKG